MLMLSANADGNRCNRFTTHRKFTIKFVLYAESVSSAGSVGYVGSLILCCEILLLLNVADMVYVESCGVSSAEYRVHVV